MASTAGFRVFDSQGKELARANLWSAAPTPTERWLKWVDYSKGEIDLEKLPEGAKKIKVIQEL
jgi:hypothetical protein